jgi:hypothetical protein
MENQKRLWLGDPLYTATIFGGYAALSQVWQPVRHAA